MYVYGIIIMPEAIWKQCYVLLVVAFADNNDNRKKA